MSEKQKPQAWMLITEQGVCGGIERFRYDAEVKARELGERFSIVPLYYEIPNRKLIPLTEEELLRCECDSDGNLSQIAKLIMDRILEKNK
jgi:hypothetical protein